MSDVKGLRLGCAGEDQQENVSSSCPCRYHTAVLCPIWNAQLTAPDCAMAEEGQLLILELLQLLFFDESLAQVMQGQEPQKKLPKTQKKNRARTQVVGASRVLGLRSTALRPSRQRRSGKDWKRQIVLVEHGVAFMGPADWLVIFHCWKLL